MTVYLTKDQVIEINKRLILMYSEEEIIGVKNHPLLESALSRPMQSIFGEDAYETIYDKSSALFHSLVKNHPFHNGNKRTALAVLTMFLDMNNVELTMSSEQAEDFTVDVANDLYSLGDMAELIKNNSIYVNMKKN